MKKFVIWLLAITVVLSLSSCKKSILDPNNPITIEIWHYYNGTQLIAFDDMINEFNHTLGHELGIYVKAENQGGVNDLGDKILSAARQETGSPVFPDIFGSYADTAYATDKLGKVANLSGFLSDKEKEEYVDYFFNEGYISGDNKLKIFPIAKSTEILMINKNVWDEFTSSVPDITDEKLSTWEGIYEVSEVYYNWSGGKALFGIDSLANFILISMKQMGSPVIETENGQTKVVLDKEKLHRIWDIYYKAMVRGYFASIGRYRSDDVKTGEIAGFVGSSTGGAYFPEDIIYEDGKTIPAFIKTFEYPVFSNGKKIVIQQGAGMVVASSDEKHEYASVEFLKWFTEAERNLVFAMNSSYMPVKKEALSGKLMDDALEKLSLGTTADKYMSEVFKTSLKQMETYEFYFTPPFEGSYDFRKVLENELKDRALKARATVIELISSGKSFESAVAVVDTEDEFEEWINVIKASIPDIY